MFKNNEFLLASTDAGQFVLQGKVVHIPQAGALPGVEKNRTALPATVVQRADNDVLYTLDEYSTDPILIPNAENFELSYSKRESVLAEHEASLRQTVADNILIAWSPTGSGGTIVRTTGSSTATHLDGTTGNRKRFTVKDLKRAQHLMNRQNIPMEGRYALISADMFQQLTNDMSVTEYRDFSAAYDIKDGIIGRLFGFNLMMRSGVVTYDNASEPNVRNYGIALDAAENDGVLCWQTSAVEHALGQVSFFENIGDAQYYGDVYSLSVRVGGRQRWASSRGIIAIVQDEA